MSVLPVRDWLVLSILHSFLVDDNVGPEGVKMSKTFHVQPPSSALYPADKAQTVAITFRSDKEVELKDLAVLKCQVLHAHGRASRFLPLMYINKLLHAQRL